MVPISVCTICLAEMGYFSEMEQSQSQLLKHVATKCHSKYSLAVFHAIPLDHMQWKSHVCCGSFKFNTDTSSKLYFIEIFRFI